MPRRKNQAALEVQVSFEPARIAPQCLVHAYERVLPVQRRPTRLGASTDARRGETNANGQRASRGSEHG